MLSEVPLQSLPFESFNVEQNQFSVRMPVTPHMGLGKVPASP